MLQAKSTCWVIQFWTERISADAASGVNVVELHFGSSVWFLVQHRSSTNTHTWAVQKLGSNKRHDWFHTHQVVIQAFQASWEASSHPLASCCIKAGQKNCFTIILQLFLKPVCLVGYFRAGLRNVIIHVALPWGHSRHGRGHAMHHGRNTRHHRRHSYCKDGIQSTSQYIEFIKYNAQSLPVNI